MESLLKEYKNSRPKKASSTMRADQLAFGKLKTHLGGSRLIQTITVKDVEMFRASLLKGLSPVTVNLHFRHLRAAFNAAMRWKYIEENPFSLPPEPEPEREPELVVDEVLRKILAATEDGEKKRLVLFALYTGMRPFEISRLKYENRVGGFIKMVGKRGRARMIPIVGDCAELFGAGDPQAWVFPRWRNPESISKMFRKLADDAGYPKGRLYDLRHTAASVLTAIGADVQTVSKMMGHTSTTTTLRYIHITKKHLERLAGKMDLAYKQLTKASADPIVIDKDKGISEGTDDS